MLVAIAAGQLHLLLLQLGQPALGGLNLDVLHRDRQRVGRHRAADEQWLDLAVLRLFLDARHLRFRDGVVERVEARDHDVLLVVERHRVLLVAIVRERAFALFHLGLLVRELLAEPLQHVFRGRQLRLKILVDVLVHQCVGRQGGERRVDRVEGDVHEAAAAHRLDADTRDECRHQPGLVRRLVDLRRFLHDFRLTPDHRHQARARRGEQRQRRLRRRGRAVEFRNLIEPDFLDHAAREIASAQNLVLRLEIRFGIFEELFVLSREAWHGRRPFVFDQQAALAAEVLDVRVALNHHRRRRQDEHRDRDAAIAVEHRDAVQNVDVGVGSEPRRSGSCAACACLGGGPGFRAQSDSLATVRCCCSWSSLPRPRGSRRPCWTPPPPP